MGTFFDLWYNKKRLVINITKGVHMAIEKIFVLPHPPVLIEEVGGGESHQLKNTREAYECVRKEIEEIAPDLILFISPHGPVFIDAIAVYDLEEYKGSLSDFGCHKTYTFLKSEMFIKQLMKKEEEESLGFYALNKEEFLSFQYSPVLDYGVLVPLHFLEESIKKIPMVCMTFANFSFESLLRAGKRLQELATESKQKTILLCSGDLSHTLSLDAPCGYHSDGEKLDTLFKEAMASHEPFHPLLADSLLIENAKPCLLEPYAMALGATLGYKKTTSLLSYEAPFGVGYLVASISLDLHSPLGDDQGYNHFIKTRQENAEQRIIQSHSLVKVARKTIEHLLVYDELPRFEVLDYGIKLAEESVLFEADELRRFLSESRGVFVSIKNHRGLRGCMGSVVPRKKSILEEVIFQTKQASMNDPRFDPLSQSDLLEITVTVELLSDLERVENSDELNPQIYGVLIQSGENRSLLLPNLEGIDDVETQLKIASNKGGFTVNEIETIHRFTVEKFV